MRRKFFASAFLVSTILLFAAYANREYLNTLTSTHIAQAYEYICKDKIYENSMLDTLDMGYIGERDLLPNKIRIRFRKHPSWDEVDEIFQGVGVAFRDWPLCFKQNELVKDRIFDSTDVVEISVESGTEDEVVAKLDEHFLVQSVNRVWKSK